MNKTWEKPVLVILAKGTPEENVLQHCKTMNPNKSLLGPAVASQETCASGSTTSCDNCNSRGVGKGS